MFKRLVHSLLHLSWFLVFITFMLGILSISLVWLTSSNIDDLRPKILEWVNETTGQPVEVDALEVEWRGIIPHLKLSGIEVFDRNTHHSLTRFDQARLSVDLYHSLAEWKVKVGNLEFSGLTIELVHEKDGKISLRGLSEKASDSDQFSHWLLEQPHLKLTNSNITWHEKKWRSQTPQKITLNEVELDLTNKRIVDQHFLQGSARFAENQSGFKFDLKIKGNPLDSNWNADLNIVTEQVGLTPYLPKDLNEKLYSELQNDHFFINNPTIDSNTTIRWNNSKLTGLDGYFSLRNSGLINSISSGFSITQLTQENWHVSLPQLLIKTQDHRLQPLSAHLQVPMHFSFEKPELDASLSKIDLNDLFKVLPESLIKKVTAFQPEGNLQNIRLHLDQNNSPSSFVFESEFSDLNTLPSGKIPGFKNLAGKVQINSDLASLVLDSQHIQINRLLKTGGLEPSIELDKLNGQLDWQKSDQGWKLTIPQITFVNPDLEFQLTGSIDKQARDSHLVDLQGTFFRGNVEPIIKMIPSNLLHAEVNKWLDRSIISGRLTAGNVIFRGALEEFPFTKNNGLFEVRLTGEEGILDYFEGWPRIEEISAEVVFDSQKMVITSPNAKIYNADLKDTIVEIPNFQTENYRLLIIGNAIGDMKDGLRFIDNSPLKTSVGKQLEHMEINGKLNLDLKLEIPLGGQSTPLVDGAIHLNKNTLSLGALGIKLKALKGDFLFDQNRWYGKRLKALLFDSAIKIFLDIDDRNSKSDVRLSGIADKNYILNRMVQIGMEPKQLKVLDSLTGSTAWQAQLSLPKSIGSPDEETGLLISSDLKGLKIEAPAPLGKTTVEIRPLKINTTLSEKQKHHVGFDYNNMLFGDIDFITQNKTTDLQKLTLNFGSKNSPKKNLKHLVTIGGSIDTLDTAAWVNFFDQISEPRTSYQSPKENFLSINLNIAQLNAFGQKLINNHIVASTTADSWRVAVSSKNTEGIVTIPYQAENNPVKANFERFKIVSSKNDKQNSTLNPELIPELQLTSNSLQYNDLNLGSLQLHIKPEERGINVNKLVLSSPATTISVNGHWKKQNKRQMSEFNIQAKGKKLSPMLNQFGFGESDVDGGKTELIINANWQGSPTEFDLKKVKGHLKIDVEQGRFTEIKNNLGKVFGLVSLQSLKRRLTLDFKDLFKKGFTFDNISGDFEIAQGNARTNNLNMIGPSANIEIVGRIGLATQDYDQLITVTPSVTDSLPVAGAVFGPVGVGVGAAIVLAKKIIPVLPNVIDKVLEQQYTLTGTWDKPLIETAIVKSQRNKSSSLLE
ncbi:MAG: YhdP family protein [Gammaproteobacteria bacterium]